MSSSSLQSVIDSVFMELDSQFEADYDWIKEDYEEEGREFIFEDYKEEWFQDVCNSRDENHIDLNGFDIMSNYHKVIKWVNNYHQDEFGENMDIENILCPIKLELHFVYWIGNEWKHYKNEGEVWTGNEWEVDFENPINDNNLNQLNNLIGSDIEVNDSDSDYEEEEEKQQQERELCEILELEWSDLTDEEIDRINKYQNEVFLE